MELGFLVGDFLELAGTVWHTVSNLWMFVLFGFLLPVAPGMWLVYAQAYYSKSIKYTVIELRLPREVRKTPRAMEQVWTAIHALRNSPAPSDGKLMMILPMLKEKWWDGEVTQRFTAEMASFGGEIHFYMHVPENKRIMLEAALYSQYQDLEIAVVEDYVNRMPKTYAELRAKGYELYGNELILSRPDVFPIRTFVDFEAVAEEKELDPISGVLEMLAKIKPQEMMWLQIVTAPLVDDFITQWVKEGEDAISKIKAKARTTVDPETGQLVFTMPSPAETDQIKAIDRNVGRPGFNVVIRYLWIARKEDYSGSFGQRSLYSALNQYATETFNKFKHNVFVWTRLSWWYPPFFFSPMRLTLRRERIFKRYRERKIYDDTRIGKVVDMQFFNWGGGGKNITLNTEELATIFHLPTQLVLTAPLVKRIEAKKGGPPAGLAIYGGEKEELPGIKSNF